MPTFIDPGAPLLRFGNDAVRFRRWHAVKLTFGAIERRRDRGDGENFLTPPSEFISCLQLWNESPELRHEHAGAYVRVAGAHALLGLRR